MTAAVPASVVPIILRRSGIVDAQSRVYRIMVADISPARAIEQTHNKQYTTVPKVSNGLKHSQVCITSIVAENLPAHAVHWQYTTAQEVRDGWIPSHVSTASLWLTSRLARQHNLVQQAA